MSWTPPVAADFKAFFVRDFNYAPSNDSGNLNYVIDADITKAIADAALNFNPIYGTDAQCTTIFMYLAAFFLVNSIQLSGQGLGSRSDFPISSKSVGGVSVGFSIPEKYLKDPQIALYVQNGYGLKYLSMVWPYTIGGAQVVQGTTTYA